MQQEYLTELFYPTRFYDFMSPVLLDYIAALHGFAPHDLSQDFHYGELACGGGLTLLTLADCYPQARFTGIDINAEHIAYAQKLADSAQLSNARLLEADICELDLNPLEGFDFLTMHGLYSWVSANTREHIHRLLTEKLNPGGLFMISYNAMPGSAMIQPIRDMMQAYTEGMEGSTLDKVEAGIQYLEYLCEKDAAYFHDNPLAREAVASLRQRDTHYLAHEFFNQNWQAFYFSEVAQRMSELGLSFVGTLPLCTNYLQASIPQDFQEFFQTAPDRVTLERHKAFVRNERFRRDLYIKTDTWAANAEQIAEWLYSRNFGSEYYYYDSPALLYPAPEEQISIDLEQEPHHSIASALLDRGQSLADLQQSAELQNYSSTELVDALNMICLSNDFRPFARPGASELPEGNQLQLCIPSALNRHLLETCQSYEERVIYLASPIIGDGVGLPLLDALLLYGLSLLPPEQIPAWASERLQTAGRHINIEGDIIEDPNMQTELLEQQLEHLLANKLGKYLELGLLGIEDTSTP